MGAQLSAQVALVPKPQVHSEKRGRIQEVKNTKLAPNERTRHYSYERANTQQVLKAGRPQLSPAPASQTKPERNLPGSHALALEREPCTTCAHDTHSTQLTQGRPM